MFNSETVSRAIHADRIRDLERAARDHRLLATSDETSVGPRRQATPPVPPTALSSRSACGGSTSGQPA
jgi:hypothetical protein